uniref:Uncharacterized protein n=1 Tax=Haplochromis burtoni TaxID=8153 RepID=A0A3Q2VZV0_HAPBU
LKFSSMLVTITMHKFTHQCDCIRELSALRPRCVAHPTHTKISTSNFLGYLIFFTFNVLGFVFIQQAGRGTPHDASDRRRSAGSVLHSGTYTVTSASRACSPPPPASVSFSDAPPLRPAPIAPCISFRNFLADSSACTGPLRTLTTTSTKCSNATASSTSMPLLQRAAALQPMEVNQYKKLI